MSIPPDRYVTAIDAGTLLDTDAFLVLPAQVGTTNLKLVPADAGAATLVSLLGTHSPESCGAIGDGTSHPLSERYGTLAAAQVVYAHATDLTNEIDWAAWQEAVNRAGDTTRTDGVGGTIAARPVRYVVNKTIAWKSNVSLRGTWGGKVDSGAGPINGTQLLWNGATGQVILDLFNVEYVHLDGFSIRGNGIANCTALRVDSDNGGAGPIVTTHNLSISHFSIDHVGVTGTNGVGIQLNTSGIAAKQSDGIHILNFAIRTVHTPIAINSGNVDYTTIEQGSIQTFVNGVDCGYCGNVKFRNLAFGSGLGTSTCFTFLNDHGDIIIEGCQGESCTNTLIASAALATHPIILIANRFDAPSSINAAHRLIGIANYHATTFALTAAGIIYRDFGDYFAVGGSMTTVTGASHLVMGEAGQVQALTPAAGATITPDVNLGNIVVVTMPAGNITINLPVNTRAGGLLTFIVIQDGVGGRVVLWGSSGYHRAWVPTMAANKADTITFIHAGSNVHYQVGQGIGLS